MAYTPQSVLKTRVVRVHTYFSKYGCRAQVYTPTQVLESMMFHGEDGHKVRAEATEWVEALAERIAVGRQTAWRSVRDSQKTSWA